jgi:hypothetical protein
MIFIFYYCLLADFANETLLQDLDSTTNYRVIVLFYTKYNTKGFSNELQFMTTSSSQ